MQHKELEFAVIYKPVAGERPLWDFPDGTLADREYAAYLISESTQLNIVPRTVLRDGPFGIGMVQEWIDIDESVDLGSFFSRDLPGLRKMALFDAITNNTDRKIGHILPTRDGEIYGCDHGVTFHEEDKLRTVIWQFSGLGFDEKELTLLHGLQASFNDNLGLELRKLISGSEFAALTHRIDKLITTQVFPSPSPDWPAIPWPAF